MLRLVDRAPRPRQLALEVRHPLVERREVVTRGAGAQGQLLLDVPPQGPLGMRFLLGQAQPALAEPDRRAQTLGLLARPHQVVLEPVYLRGELGGAAPGARGGELGAACPARLEQVGVGQVGRLAIDPPVGFDREPHVADRQRHHHPAELEERPAGKRRGQVRRHREVHPPRAGGGPDERGRLGHGQEPLSTRPSIDHEHRLPPQLSRPPAPPAGHAYRNPGSLRNELDRLDPE